MPTLKGVLGLISVCLLAFTITSRPVTSRPVDASQLSVAGTEGKVDLSYSFSLSNPSSYGGANCRILSVPRNTPPLAPRQDSSWQVLLCSQNSDVDASGNPVELMEGYFPQLQMKGNVKYNWGTGLMTIAYDDGRSGILYFTPGYTVHNPYAER
jgi:hypothetical protein